MAKPVTLNFDVDELVEEVEDAIADSIADGVDYARREFLTRIPSQRRETRRSVRAEAKDMSGKVGVRFPASKRYRKQGTTTERIVEDAWRAMEAPTLKAIEDSFEVNLEEISR